MICSYGEKYFRALHRIFDDLARFLLKTARRMNARAPGSWTFIKIFVWMGSGTGFRSPIAYGFRKCVDKIPSDLLAFGTPKIVLQSA